MQRTANTPYITICEFEKTLDLNKYKFTRYSPFVYSQQLSFYNYSSYLTNIYTATNDINNIKRNIINITINYIPYAKKLTLADCQLDEESYFFDILTQTIYIHLNHSYSIFDYEIYGGDVIGFSDRGDAYNYVKYYNDIPYTPQILQIPNLNIGINPNKYDKMAFFGGDFVLNNLPTDYINISGFFDDSYLDSLVANLITLKFGLVDYPYASLLEIAKFGITSQEVYLNNAKLNVIDQRQLLTKQIPEDYFDSITYPNIGDDIIGKIIPLCFGIRYGVPGICINVKSAGSKTFKLPMIDILFDIWVKQPNDTWLRVVPTAIDAVNGLITIAEADIYQDGDDSKQLLSMKIDGIFGMPGININPGDIIKYILDEYYGITFDASGYNMAEFTAESNYLDDVGIYIDSKKNIYEIIEMLQNSSNFGFYFQHIYDTRTIRIDNPNRAITRTIQAVENMIIGDPGYKILENDFYSSAIVGYKPDTVTNNRNKYSNLNYYDAVTREYHNKENEASINIDAIEQQTAIDRSIVLLEDMQKARPRYSIQLSGITAFSLRLLDILSVDFTQYYIDKNRDLMLPHKKDRLFTGIQRCKIIGIKPDLKNGNIVFNLKQCDYSDAVQNIIDNKILYIDRMQYYSSIYFSKYWLNYSGSGEITFVIDGTDKVLSVGNNSGNDMQWVYHSKLIEYDSSKLYEVKATIKTTAGIGTIYVGIEGINADGSTMENITGANLHTSQHYFAADNIAPTAAWVEYKGYFTGYAAAGNGGQHNNIYDPGTVHEDAFYIRGMFCLNYNGAAGTMQVKDFCIRKITN